MKIAIASDLHLEFDPYRLDNPLRIDNTEGADVLVLAGDIITKDIREDLGILEFFEHVSKQFSHVIYIMGNHEHYRSDIGLTKEKISEVLAEFPNIHFLEKEFIILDNVGFFGATFWTDLNKGSVFTALKWKQYMSDHNYIREGGYTRKLQPETTIMEHHDTLEKLKEALQICMVPKMVVVSHHSPSPLSVPEKYQDQGDVNNAYYSDLSEIMLDNPIIKLWIHGHTHDSFDYEIGETRVVCNPRGYMGYEDTSKWQLKYVEV